MRALSLLPVFAVIVAAGCDDDLGPRAWDATPDTVEIFSLDRPEYLGLPSGFDVVSLQPVVIEQPGSIGNWDFALRESDGTLLLSPASTFPGLDSRAGIGVVEGETFGSLARAPSDTTFYRRTESVPVEAGVVYVVRSRRYFLLGGTCVAYAKLAAVEVDATDGTFQFEVVRNPNCNDRSFIPPK